MAKGDALSGVRVLEISHDAAAVAGRILADLGAEVIKIEPPGGEVARLNEPVAVLTGGERISFFWLAYNVGKKSIAIDLNSLRGQAEFVELAATADIVLTDYNRCSLESNDSLAAMARERNPLLIWTEIWPYGRGEPHERHPGGELVAQAMGGHLYLNGDEDRPPVMIGLPVATCQSGAEAASATLSAYYHRLLGGEGQRVDVSMQECITWTLLNTTMIAQLVNREYKRGGAVKRERANTFATRLVWPCADGYIYFSPIGGGGGSARETSYASLVAWMAEEGLTDPALTARDWSGKDQNTIGQNEYDKVAVVIGNFIAGKSQRELIDRAVADRILLAPISDVPSIMSNPQLLARGYFAAVQDAGRETRLEYPTNWVRMSRTPVLSPSPAPDIDANRAELRSASSRKGDVATSPERPARAQRLARQVFDGLKILDFTWAAAGPIMTKQFADNGATVLKVESSRHPDSVRLGGPYKDDIPGINRSGFFAEFNTSKLSMTIDGGHPRAKELIYPLVEWADVVAESFRPGVMTKWGFGYDDLRRVNPRVVMVSSSLHGNTGPWHKHPGFGTQGQALAGIHGMTGWPDRPPAAPQGAYTDSVAPRFAMSAVMAALIHRDRTGEGQYIELSQIEASLMLLSPQILQYQHTGKIAERNGNADERALVHGVFPCQGEDRWIAIEVWNERTYDALLQVLSTYGATDGLQRDLTASMARSEAEDALGLLTEKWDAFELMRACRERGVAAGVVLKGSDLLAEETLCARQHFWDLDHPEMGTLKYNGPAYRFETTPSRLTRAAPCIGQDTERVLSEILSLSASEIASYREDGVLR